jgi:hypothetical protein
MEREWGVLDVYEEKEGVIERGGEGMLEVDGGTWRERGSF